MKTSPSLIATTAMILILAATPYALAQQGFSTIEERMTGKEFTDAGLDKLSDEELATLNQWLRAHSVATLDNVNQEYSDVRGFETQAMAALDDGDIVSPIKGEFSGWTGDTVFELENGMIWQQAEGGTFYIPAKSGAVAIIDKGVFNAWRLKVDGYNKTIRVKRLQ
ncbi:MAG: hypothetical protein V2I57_14260 [Xanthomonadales bacterium]|nr:hypothetical protein [Xanthomonadales bacterium]